MPEPTAKAPERTGEARDRSGAKEQQASSEPDLGLGMTSGLVSGRGVTPALPPGTGSALARMRTVLAVQRQAGNAAAQQLLARSRRGDATGAVAPRLSTPVVQRGLWGMDRPPNTPQPPPDLRNRISQLTDPAYASFQLRATWTKGGHEMATRLSKSVVDEIAAAGPDPQRQVGTTFTAELDKLVGEERQAVAEFEAKSRSTLEAILDTSAKKLEDEMRRYGFSETVQPGGSPGSGKASLSPTADMAKMAAAAQELVAADSVVANLQIRLGQKYAAAHPGGPMEAQVNRDAVTRDINSDPSFVEAVQTYEKLFAKHLSTFPMLAAYRGKGFDLNALAQAQKSPAAAAIAAQPLLDKRRDIDATRGNIASGKLSVYGLPSIVTVAKGQLAAPPGSLKERFIDDRVAQVKSDKATVDLALGAIATAAMVAATVATAGGAAIVAGTATGVGIGIGAAQLLEKIDQFGVAASAGNTDLDRARAISQSDPSLFWLALDIAMFVTDVVAAGALFRSIAGPVRKLVSLRAAAVGGAKLSEAEAAKITQVFEHELKPALSGLPQPAQARVAGALDPTTAMPAVVASAGSGKWTFAAVRNMLQKTSSGQRVLTLVDQHGLTIVYSPNSATYYNHKLKSVFISEASSAEDAMNALVHEVEHADWMVTGKSALAGNVKTMTQDEFVQRMCREEAAAEASTIRNKFALQTLLNKRVVAAPTEQIYVDAFIAQAHGLRGSAMPEAEKIVICARRGENALAEAFFHGKITNSVDGKNYHHYYSEMWVREQARP